VISCWFISSFNYSIL